MYTITNPQNPFSRTGLSLIGNAEQSLPALGAAGVGYFVTLPVQRLVKAAFNMLGIESKLGSEFTEMLSTATTVAGGLFLSRAIRDDNSRTAFQAGVLFGGATPLFSGALEWIKGKFPVLAGGWDNPRRVSATPSMSGGRFMADRKPTRMERVNRTGANYSGRNVVNVPGQFSVLQGDNPKFLPKQ